jgi:sugar phosphate isomerase/epimerase
MTAEPDALAPRPEHRFTFGLWTVGNRGRDPFGEPTRAPLDPVATVHRLADLGAWGVSLHDDDLVPWGTPAAERERIVGRFAAALEERGMGVGMATTNLFTHPAFKDGAFTSNDRRVRRAALGKAMRSIDLAARLRAENYIFWGGREGTEVGSAKDPRDALERYREAIDVLSDYVVGQGYDLRFAIEPKPNEPRGDLWLPTVGHALHFISTLARPDMVGVNPEVAHETMAGLSFTRRSARRCGPASSSTSTSTRSGSGATTRTSGSGPRTSRRPSTSSACSSARATTGRGTSTRTPTGRRTPTACGTSRPAACGPTSRWPSAPATSTRCPRCSRRWRMPGPASWPSRRRPRARAGPPR